ncbi:MAG: hypothetical protein EOP11_12740 [Proteobacteria bacterium]|nr:MAG: hypothetical protein EOP11_12740 [Pseudomonadota bacterium]
MVSNRLPPIVRTFFATPATAATAGGINKDSQGQQSGYGQEPERDATEEEAKTALEALCSSEEFKKNGLSGEISLLAGYPVIIVKNTAGTALRSLRGREILRLLRAPAPNDSSRSGRILDRRI